jgi:hypothetical protein
MPRADHGTVIDDADPSFQEPGDAGSDGPPAPPGRAIRPIVIAVVVSLVPLLVAAVRTLRSDWVVVGDSALIAVRSHDVFSRSPPTLGLWAYTSVIHDFDYNHPGPLLFDLFALPTVVFGENDGVIVGNVVLNACAFVGIVVVAYRRGGLLAASVATAVGAALCTAMGMAALVEPWHANSTVLPFVLLGLLVWSITRGDVVCLPWAAVVGSLVLQTSLSYVLLVPGLAVWAVVGLALELRRRRRTDAPAAVVLRRRAWRWGMAAAALLALCWAQPLWEQFTGAGEGNLSRLARSAGRPLTELSPLETIRTALQVGLSPPRSPDLLVADASRDLGASGFVQAAMFALALGALAVVVTWCVKGARRNGDIESSSLLVTAAVVLVLGIVTAARAPAPGLLPYQVRWLWPMGAFLVFALVTAVVRRLDDGGWNARLVGAFLLVTALGAVFNLVPSEQGYAAPPESYRVSAELVRQMDGAEVEGPVLMVCRPPTAPYCQAVMVELDSRGVTFLGEGPRGLRVVGASRSPEKHEPRQTVVVLTGGMADLPRPGAKRIAHHEGIDDRERSELFFLSADLSTYLGRPGDHLTDQGRRAIEQDEFPKLQKALSSGASDDEVSFDFGDGMTREQRIELAVMIDRDLLKAGDRWSRRMDRFAELTNRAAGETVAVFVEPPP